MKKILRVREKRKSKLESKGKQMGEGNDFVPYLMWPSVPLGIKSGWPF